MGPFFKDVLKEMRNTRLSREPDTVRCDCCGRKLEVQDWAYFVHRIKNNDVMTDLDTDPVIWVDSIICGRCMESVAKAWQEGPKMQEYLEESMDASALGKTHIGNPS